MTAREVTCIDFGTSRQAQARWARTPLPSRLRVVRRFRQRLAANGLDLAEALASWLGAPVAEILAAEILPLADACRFLEREAPRILRPRNAGWRGRPLWLHGVRSKVTREPFGVVLVIGPSNYPLFLPGVQTLQALTAGNAVLWKPGRGGTLAAERTKDLLVQAGLDQDLLRILGEDPAEAEAAIDAGVDKIVLTGAFDTGVNVLHRAAESATPVVAELSGCDAASVLPDADLDLVERAFEFALRLRSGNTCIAPHRVFVTPERAGELEERLVRVARRLPAVANPRTSDLAELVADAVDRGARVCAGVAEADREVLSPLVLADARADMAILQNDLFGPVVAIVKVRTVEEAVLLAEQCPYRLGAVIFGNPAEARRLAARLRVGVVLINDVIVPTADPRLPFAGQGRSGFGATRGPEGLLEMTTPRAIITRTGRPLHLGGWPAPAFFHTYLRLVHGTWRQRLAALLGFLKRKPGHATAAKEEIG